MKAVRKTVIVFGVSFCVFVVVLQADASILWNVPDGGWTQMLPDGNGNFDNLRNVDAALMQGGYSNADLTFLGKLGDFDESTGAVGEMEGPYAGAFGTQFNTGPDLQSGTWTFDLTTDLGSLQLAYFSLKAGGHWNLWTVTGTVNGNELTASWDISPGAPAQHQLWRPDGQPSANLSHITFWGVKGEGPLVIPEPSAIAIWSLMAAAGIWLASHRRQK